MLLQCVDDDLVGRLSFSVNLWEAWSREVEFDSPISAKVLEVVANELGAIIRHYLYWKLESTNDVLSNESLDFVISYSGESLGFDPLRVIVCERKHVDSLAWSCWELAYDVHTSLYEWQENRMRLSLSGKCETRANL